MSTHTLASYTAAGITLTTAGYDLSPFTITSAGTIQDGGVSNGIAVFSSIADPTLVNDGSINTYEGIKLTNGATVINNAILRGAAKRSANGYSYIASLVYVSGGEGVVLNNAKIHSTADMTCSSKPAVTSAIVRPVICIVLRKPF